MEPASLAALFSATLDPNHREAAEKKLNSLRKIINFGPLVLQHASNPQADQASRTAAAIFLKNYIVHQWDDVTEHDIKKAQEKGEGMPFAIHEQDKAVLREQLLEAVIDSPEVVRAQLAVALESVLKADFPEKYTNIVQRVRFCLESQQHQTWYGALMALYRLVHAFEYRPADDRIPLDEAVKFLQPLLLQRMQELLPDTSEASVSLIKICLKIFFCYVQYDFPLKVFDFKTTEGWMLTILKVFESPVPAEVDKMEQDERQETIWWKTKKWCLHIFAKVFDRYGNPKDTKKEYHAFANFFVGNLAKQILLSVFTLLSSFIHGKYVSPRCLQQSLTYVRQALKVPSCWKLIKPHATDLLARVIFPLMCYKEEDIELWQEDPIEWILCRTDVHAEYLSPEAAAQYLLHTLCKKHPKLIPDILTFIMANLTDDPARIRDKDGALHFLGIAGRTLMRRKPYKEGIESILVKHGFPEMSNPHPFIRYRAVWLFRQFAYLEYKNKDNLHMGLESARRLLMDDTQLPVRVESALALNEILDNQKAAEDFLRPHAINILRVTLDLVRLTNYEELSEVLQTFVVEFPDEVSTCATDLAGHLLQTFQNIVQKSKDSQDDERSNSLTGMSVLQTLELLNDCTTEKPQLNAQLAPIIIQVIQIILQHDLAEFYEEMFGLLTSLTSKRITPSLWEGFNICGQILAKPDCGIDYFSDMVVCLYNYATRDREGFLSDPARLEKMCTMCEHVLGNDEAGEEAQCHAAKLLEVLVLTYKGLINQYVPAIMQVVFSKLFSNVVLSELKTQLILVIVAALYYDPTSTLAVLQTAKAPDGGDLIEKFVKMWLDEVDCMFGLHDKKLAVLGLTIFMQLPPALRSPVVQALGPKLLPAALLLFQGLKRIYTHRDDESEEEWTDDEGDEEVVNTDDEDSHKKEMDDGALEGAAEEEEEDADDEDWGSDGYQSETLKHLTTPVDDEIIDEFAIFKQTIMNVQQHDLEWWNVLAHDMSETNKNLLGEMIKFADERHLNKAIDQPHVKQQ
ncbi:Importin-8 [Hypsibius exemplaris]|uniref:Importin-8 n=1 Tax=Hypsibius exemplaris TaxID=2072580 RepID=A0A1W0WFF0_HYPEX|nr:Importin-8 [Hypsibius exemplaris]